MAVRYSKDDAVHCVRQGCNAYVLLGMLCCSSLVACAHLTKPSSSHSYPSSSVLQKEHDVTHTDQLDAVELAKEITPLLKQAHVHHFKTSQLTPEKVFTSLQKIDPHAAILSDVSYQSLLHFAADNLVGVGIELHYHEMPQKATLSHTERHTKRMLTTAKGKWRIRYQPVVLQNKRLETSLPEGMEVLRIDGKPLAKFGLDNEAQVNRLLLGKINSTVQLTVVNSFGQLQNINLQRKQAVESDIHFQVIDDVAVVTVPSFVFNTSEQIGKAFSNYMMSDEMMSDATSQKAKTALRGIVIDLRNNPGGVIDAAQETGMLFSEKMPLVELHRHDSTILLKTYRYQRSFLKRLGLSRKHFLQLQKLPLVILVNGNTASAAEAFASGFQASGRAKVYGQKTYGKGSVQQILPLSDGRALRITVAKYVAFNGESIDGVGMLPNYDLAPLAITTDADMRGFIRQVFTNCLRVSQCSE